VRVGIAMRTRAESLRRLVMHVRALCCGAMTSAPQALEAVGERASGDGSALANATLAGSQKRTSRHT
jgi:hypothetical protein